MSLSRKMTKNPRSFLFVNPEKCIGCSLCEYACSWEKEKAFNPLNSRIRIVRVSPFITLAMTCILCEDAPCISSCPRDALSRSEETGTILVNQGRCDGCAWCIAACPYGAIRYDPNVKAVVICDLCDGNPRCKEICPEEALEFATSEEEMSKAWDSARNRWFEEAEKIMRLSKGEKVNIFKDAAEIMERIDNKLRELIPSK